MKAVVTGGCSGLGLYFTEYLLSLGYKVYALYNKSVDNAIMLENKYDDVRCVKCDIRNEEEVNNFFFNVDNIDLVINNAGIALDNDYVNKTKKEFMSVLETNVFGTFNVIKNSINTLTKDAVIINISSNNALDNYNPISMDYDASKAGVNMLTKDFAIAIPNKIISICPGWIATPSVMEMNPDYLKEEMNKVNQSKLIDPLELVKYILINKDIYSSGDIVEIKEV